LELFKKHEIEEVYFTGLALDYCVFWSSKDAKAAGFDTFVIEDATRGIGAVTIEHAKTVMMVCLAPPLPFPFDFMD
jgi:nicotinamidase/pyrazinamidase